MSSKDLVTTALTSGNGLSAGENGHAEGLQDKSRLQAACGAQRVKMFMLIFFCMHAAGDRL